MEILPYNHTCFSLKNIAIYSGTICCASYKFLSLLTWLFNFLSLASVHHYFNSGHYYFHWIYHCNGVGFICKRVDTQTIHLSNVKDSVNMSEVQS